MRFRLLRWLATAVVVGVLLFGVVDVGVAYTVVNDYADSGGYRSTLENIVNEYPWVSSHATIPTTYFLRPSPGGRSVFFSSIPAISVAVDTNLKNPYFSDQVAHEFAHVIWFNEPTMQQGWYAELTRRGYPPSSWSSTYWYRNPVECFAENFKRALYSPFYTAFTTPNTELAWFNRADFKAFLFSYGIAPYAE